MQLAPTGLDSLLSSYLLAFLIFVGPGHMLSSALLEPLGLTREQRLSITIVTGGLIGYAFFWLYVLAPQAGLPAALLLAVATLLGLAAHVIAGWSIARWVGRRWLVTPIFIAFLVGLLYLALLTAPGSGHFGEISRVLFFETIRPHDNKIPQEFATALYEMSPALFAPNADGWFFSDRPPLQTGVVLSMYPLLNASGVAPAALAIGTVLQVMAIPALWMIARLLPVGGGRARFALLLVIATGFVFYNSVYVWPKMIAAAYFLIAARPFLAAWARRETVSSVDMAIAAAAAACALLAHGATAFAGLGLALLVLLFVAPWRVRVTDLLFGLVVAAAIYAPWQYYVSEIAPNQGRLLKTHLAGVQPSNDEPAVDSVLRTYRNLDWEAWQQDRLISLERLVRDPAVDNEILRQGGAALGLTDRPADTETDRGDIDPGVLDGDWRSFLTVLRIDQREFVFRSLWLLNIGWLVFLFAPRGMLRSSVRDRGETGLFALWLVSTAIWVGLLFEGGGTRTTHAPYAIVLIPMLLTACRIATLSRFWRTSLLALHAATGVLIWVIALPGQAALDSPDYVAAWQAVPIGIAVVTATLLTAICTRR